MSNVQEIESAIGKLSAQELDELHLWMEEQFPQPVDIQLKADLEALAERHAGNTRAL